ncbi:hypothetical protein LOTGIDRAFT_175483 [Lottia gigantea]|uniref:Uncharacterized protein n=1 Tax=Lottia gigantea TaxID=225164 RepID=V4ALA5_LOTGI|nr:hypothetical protein LOTGIDRAFT_175483 [Lottia gigantea]ESO94356.1 hypothetical protein LOTGIDRAFT_175483 [Lottia gigantea]
MIVVHAPKAYFGSDIQKSLGSLPGFPLAKYPGEKHLPGHNYTGPDLPVFKRQQPSPKIRLREKQIRLETEKMKFPKEKQAAISIKLLELEKKNIIERTYHEEGEFISNIFTREKKDGGLRLILD